MKIVPSTRDCQLKIKEMKSEINIENIIEKTAALFIFNNQKTTSENEDGFWSPQQA